jgi:uncharacterized protein (TIGR02246 family)
MHTALPPKTRMVLQPKMHMVLLRKMHMVLRPKMRTRLLKMIMLLHRMLPRRRKPGHGEGEAGADHQANAAPPVPAQIAPTTRVRTRDRSGAASAVAAEQASSAHDAHADAAANAHGDSKHADATAAPAAAEKVEVHAAADTKHADSHSAPAKAAQHDASNVKAADTHQADASHAAAPPAVPASIEPTQRQRVKSPAAASTASPAAAAHADAHDDHHTPDTHGQPAKSAPAAKHAAKQGDSHDAHHDAKHDTKHDTAHAKGTDAQATSASAGDECNPPLKAEIASLFDRWNASLRTGDPRKVVANYAPDSVLLPTVSNRARFTIAEKEDYFVHFLQRRPQGYIDDRIIDVDCNSATDAGLYTFRFSDGSSVKARYSFSYKKINGQWLITSHHSSGMPEKPEAPATAHADSHAAPKSSDSGGSTKGWVRFP